MIERSKSSGSAFVFCQSVCGHPVGGSPARLQAGSLNRLPDDGNVDGSSLVVDEVK